MTDTPPTEGPTSPAASEQAQPSALARLIRGDAVADSTVPPSGVTGHLTMLAAAAMAFLAVFVLALVLAGGQTASRWSQSLAGTATLEVPLSGAAADQAVDRLRLVLSQTPGVVSVRRLPDDETRALLAPWLGDTSGLEGVALPVLLAVEEGPDLDTEALALRLSAEVTSAVYHRHAGWQAAIASAAARVQILGLGMLGLILIVSAIVITLAARASMAMNADVIKTLRLLGARDSFVVRAFVRRFTLRGLSGALLGTVLGIGVLLGLPMGPAEGLAGLVPSGVPGWLGFVVIPPVMAVLSFAATRRAAQRVLAAVP